MTDETTLAYLAGIVDGEGYVGIKRSKAYRCQGRTTPSFHARVQVRMVDEAAVALLAEKFGGHLYLERATAARVRRPLFCYAASNLRAETLLRALLPYLRIKRAVAERVLALRELQREGRRHRTKVTGYREFPGFYGGPRRVPNLAFSDEYVARCDALWSECRGLNHAPGWASSA